MTIAGAPSLEVWFYHLQRQPLEQVLPILAGKALERGWRLVVQTVDDLRLKALDDLLWTFRDESFLPHGLASDPHVARHPMVLTSAAGNPNEAVLRIYVEGAEIDLVPGDSAYERVMLLFDGRDEVELDAARGQWSRLKGAGFTLAYWQQDDAGRWERKMQSRPPATPGLAAG